MSKRIDNLEILKFFIDNPNQQFHIREVAKLTKLAPTTVTNYLENFKKNNILEKKKERNHVLYRANTENKSYKDIKLYYNIKKIRDSGLIDFLEDELNHPEAIVLFGSFRKSENIPSSDIDIFILSPIKKQLDLTIFEKKNKHNIQLFIHSKKELDLMKTDNKELLNNIINGIVLNGFLEVF